MICLQFRSELNALIADQLEPGRSKACQEHLAACAACRQRYAEEKNLYAALSAAQPGEAGAEYWQTYWGRLRHRIEAADPAEAASRKRPALADWRWLVPALALGCAAIGYWTGLKSAEDPPAEPRGARLAAYAAPTDEHWQPFHEILSLYPQRLNWISLMNDKLDFSINGTPMAQDEPMEQIVLAMQQEKAPLESRWMMRPGQKASAHVQWQGGEVSVQLHVDAAKKKLHVVWKIEDQDDAASLETAVALDKTGLIPLGTLRWKDQMLPLTLRRPDGKETAKDKSQSESSPETNTKL